MNTVITNSAGLSFAEKLRAYMELMKFRLSFLVAFSCAFGYLLASNSSNLSIGMMLLVSFGGFLVSGGGIIVNQIVEKDIDSKMSRTMKRPLPTGRVSVQEAKILSAIVTLTGLGLLWIVSNPVTVLLSFASWVIYGFIYTPLKRVGSIAVFVGAIPGALPPLLGWMAVTGTITYEALLIFGIQFIWQFPHFWAIAWLAFDDYKKVGIKLLPSKGEKNFSTAVQIMIYTLFLIPLGLLPAKIGLTGIDSAIVVSVCGVLFLAQTFRLMVDGSAKSARRIMFSSFFYLPIVQISFLLDKI